MPAVAAGNSRAPDPMDLAARFCSASRWSSPRSHHEHAAPGVTGESDLHHVQGAPRRVGRGRDAADRPRAADASRSAAAAPRAAASCRIHTGLSAARSCGAQFRSHGAPGPSFASTMNFGPYATGRESRDHGPRARCGSTSRHRGRLRPDSGGATEQIVGGLRRQPLPGRSSRDEAVPKMGTARTRWPVCHQDPRGARRQFRRLKTD